MPTYDYRCVTCENTFEVTRPMKSRDPETCPECGCAAKRVFSPVGVSFKGSGFHNTDYRVRPQEDSGGSKGQPCEGAKSDSDTCSGCPAAS